MKMIILIQNNLIKIISRCLIMKKFRNNNSLIFRIYNLFKINNILIKTYTVIKNILIMINKLLINNTFQMIKNIMIRIYSIKINFSNYNIFVMIRKKLKTNNIFKIIIYQFLIKMTIKMIIIMIKIKINNLKKYLSNYLSNKVHFVIQIHNL